MKNVIQYTHLIIYFVLIAYSQCQNSIYNLVLLNQTNGESCLDGSAPGYYIQNGYGEGKDNWILYMRGGAFCAGTSEQEVIDQCQQRAQTDLGSSKNWQQSYPNYFGLLNLKQNESSFYNWNHVMIMYCDGSFHQGFRKDPIITEQSTKLYFRGSINTKSVFNHLLQVQGMNLADKIVFSGASAGGVAVFMWADYLKNLIPTNIKYWAVPDSGFTFISPNVKTETQLIKQQWKNLYKVSNKDGILPNEKCVQQRKGQEEFECMYSEFNSPFIESNLFIIQSEYDSWQIPNVLGIDCINKRFSLSNCSQVQFNQIQAFRKLQQDKIKKSIIEKNNRVAWTISCSFHVLTGPTYNMKNYEVPMDSGNTVNLALYQWIQTGSTDNYIENQSWPQNSNCAQFKIFE